VKALFSSIKRHPQAAFWCIAWSTFFFGYYQYRQTANDLWQLFILGPFFAGIAVTAIADGRQGLRLYFARIISWRIPIKWYAIALILPLVLRLVALLLTLLGGATPAAEIQWASWEDYMVEFAFVFGIVALGEEPGFRGFALPRLMVGRSALAASLWLGVLHAIWHLPLLVTGDAPLWIVPIILAGAVINTWIFIHCGGSVLPAMLLHASVNFCFEVFTPLFTAQDLLWHTAWLALVYPGMALLLVVVYGPALDTRTRLDAPTGPGLCGARD
jgi:membrane protease YdiL (CAAX protease family)